MRGHCWSKPKAAVNIQFYAPINIFLHAMSFLHFTKSTPSEGRSHDFCSWKMLNNNKKQWKKNVFSSLHFFLSFQLILFLYAWFSGTILSISTISLIWNRSMSPLILFSHISCRNGASSIRHFEMDYLNALFITGISTKLANVLVIVFEKKTDKKGAEIVWLEFCYLWMNQRRV